MAPKHIKRFWLWVGVILLVELAAIMLWKHRYSVFPTHAVSEVYTRYADADGIRAAFVKDYRINDTVSVDVTFLEATDSAGWAILCRDFAIPEMEPALEQFFESGWDLDFTRQVDKHDYSKVVIGDSCDVVPLTFSYQRKTVTIFHIKNEDENRAMLYYNLHN